MTRLEYLREILLSIDPDDPPVSDPPAYLLPFDPLVVPTPCPEPSATPASPPPSKR